MEAASDPASGDAAGIGPPAAATAGVVVEAVLPSDSVDTAATGRIPRSSLAVAGPDPSGGWASILTEIRAGALVGLDPDLDLQPAEGGTDLHALGTLLSAAGARVCTAREGQLGSGMACVVCRPERAECWLDLGCHVLSEKSVAR